MVLNSKRKSKLLKTFTMLKIISAGIPIAFIISPKTSYNFSGNSGLRDNSNSKLILFNTDNGIVHAVSPPFYPKLISIN